MVFDLGCDCDICGIGDLVELTKIKNQKKAA